MVFNIILIVVISFILSFIITRFIIVSLKKVGFYKSISNDVPKIHHNKEGTPSFGGIAIFFSFLITTLIFAKHSILLFWCIFIVFGYFLIGIIDDYFNLKKTAALGLKARYKILFQFILSGISAIAFYDILKDTTIFIPIVDKKIDIGCFYIPFIMLVFIASSNAVNLTDGLDGLCAGVSLIAMIGFLYLSVFSQNMESIVICSGIIGALIGFLYFNIYPAKIFMGDTGSLMLGSIFAIVPILLKKELALLVIGAIFVVETLSVIIQVIYFKITGKRVFKMSPLHHHFELSGWSEVKIVRMFWIMSSVFTLIGVVVFR